MKKVLFIAVALLLLACSKQSETAAKLDTPVEVTTIELGEFEAKAGEYVDKMIEISGIVDHVCKHGGKRLLLVNDDGDVHIDGEERFDESLNGSKISVKGMVREFRIDEAYCLQMEEKMHESHKDDHSEDEAMENRQAQIDGYRQKMEEEDVDHLSFYSIEYVSHSDLQ